jgi:hypothetical protein
MWSKRQSVDYALQRRQSLATFRGQPRRLTVDRLCDADPMLIRAALHHGELSTVRCPIADCGRLITLNYVFGDQLGQYSGRIKSAPELEEMENEFGEFKVCVVEICTDCGWNHLIETYLLGDGVKRRPPRRQPTVEEIFG